MIYPVDSAIHLTNNWGLTFTQKYGLFCSLVLSVQCYSRCGSLSFLGFGLKTADFSLMESYNRIECFLLRVLTDLFYLSLEVLVRCYFGPRPILGLHVTSPKLKLRNYRFILLRQLI